ncbi:MAG: hypothetical protein RMJ19_05470, partial [Gemmatales bacterium]|nr:hypothetical protein [Gemmatales bacterium]MDW8175103.1 hypothetical protein [Gemmatales bacterium]
KQSPFRSFVSATEYDGFACQHAKTGQPSDFEPWLCSGLVAFAPLPTRHGARGYFCGAIR